MSNKTSFVVDREKNQVVQTRVFDAPASLVFKAYTDATLIPQWWGPSVYKTTVDKLDPKVGGAWRFVQTGNDGEEFAFRGEFKEIVPNQKLAYTFEFEPMAGHIIVETIELVETDGKTKLVSVSQFANLEDLEGMINSGMESGSVEGMERLAVLTEK